RKAARGSSLRGSSPSSGTSAPRSTTIARRPKRSNRRTRHCAGRAKPCARLSQQDLRGRARALVAAPLSGLAAGAELKRREIAPGRDETQVDEPHAAAAVRAAVERRLRCEPAEEAERR